MACSYCAKFQEDENFTFTSYENFSRTSQIAIYELYEDLLKAFQKTYERIIIAFSATKESNVSEINAIGKIYGIDSLKQNLKIKQRN